MRSRNEANNRARESHRSSPPRTIRRGRNTVERHVDALVFVRIRGLTRFGIVVALSVSVVIEDKRAPALRLLLIVRFVPNLRIEPALDPRRPERRPQHIVVV